MIEVKASEVLDKLFEKQAFDVKAVGKTLANNKKLVGAGIGAGTGALAGAAGADNDHKLSGALTGGLIGAAGGTAGGALAEKGAKAAAKAAAGKGFAAGVGVGTVGGALGTKGVEALKNKTGSDIIKGVKDTVIGNKSVGDAADEIVKQFKDKPSETIQKGLDRLNEYGGRINNLFKSSSEYPDAFANTVFEKVANEKYLFSQAIAEAINDTTNKMAMEDISAEEYVEHIAMEILAGFEERKEALEKEAKINSNMFLSKKTESCCDCG
jgi:hypothetical protein